MPLNSLQIQIAYALAADLPPPIEGTLNNGFQKIFLFWLSNGTRDPVGGMTATARALIERYRHYGVQDVSHIFYEGARHEALNDFCDLLAVYSFERTFGE